MQFTDTRTRERHEAEGFAKVSTEERLEDITTRWHGNRYETVGVPFAPERVLFRWTWAPTINGGEWVLATIRVTGPQIKKDGSHGLKTRSVDFIRRGEIVESTPAAILELAEQMKPTGRVVPQDRLS